jgi:chromosome segregation ATPase
MAGQPLIDPWSDADSQVGETPPERTLARIVAGLIREIEDLREDNRALRWRLDTLTNRLADIIGQVERLEERSQSTRIDVATLKEKAASTQAAAAADAEPPASDSRLGTWSDSLRMEVSALMDDREGLTVAAAQLVDALHQLLTSPGPSESPKRPVEDLAHGVDSSVPH